MSEYALLAFAGRHQAATLAIISQENVVSISNWLDEAEVLELPVPGTTDWLNGIRTIEEVADKNKVMGFCEHCEQWWGFELWVDKELCPTCSTRASRRIGFQLVSLRTFSPALHGVKKLPKKK